VLKLFSCLCDEQRPLTAATVRAELDCILAVVGIGELRVAVGQTACAERREATLFEWDHSPCIPGVLHAASKPPGSPDCPRREDR
jgi:hypothetical protein